MPLPQIHLRHQIIDAVRKLVSLGLNKAASGNVSVRSGERFLVTPSGMLPEDMLPGDIVEMDFDGAWQGARKPSSEWHFHRDILATRPEINAVIHTHAPFCTTLAVHGMGIPAFHYMVAMAGGRDIRCAPYATYGTQTLSDYAVQALAGRKACLLGNHGMIVLGPDLKQALSLAVEVESLAEQYWRALQIGQPNILSDAEMDVVLEKFKTYGANAQKAS